MQLIITVETHTELLLDSVFLWLPSSIGAQMMNAQGSPFVPCGSQWNHVAWQGEKWP